MNISKKNIDDFIRCQYFFSLEVLNKGNISTENIKDKKIASALNASSKRVTSDVDSNFKNGINWLRDYISKIALKELKGYGDIQKTPLHEYRLSYTNKFSKRLMKHVDTDTNLIDNLNNIFSIFSNNTFLAYNVPVELPVVKTNIIYRDVIDFVLTDDDGNVSIVEFDDLSNTKRRLRYKEWPHYKIPYSFISHSMDKDITVNIIDPINMICDFKFLSKKQTFDNEYKSLVDLVSPMKNASMVVRNLYACSGCKYADFCSEDIK